jgi:hypothetical protein
MSPELEEKLGKAMAVIAKQENDRMAQSIGSSYVSQGLRDRLKRQKQGQSGGRPRKHPKKIKQ